MRRGASDADLAKLAGLNILRVWEENERIAARLQRQRPSEATWLDRVWKQNYYGLPFSKCPTCVSCSNISYTGLSVYRLRYHPYQQ